MAKQLSTFPLTGPINLQVRLGHGSVTVTAHDDLSEASVRLTPRDPSSDILERMTVELRGPTLTVNAPHQGGLADLVAGWKRDRDAVDAEIDVPAGTALKIVTASADVIVRGRCGGADVTTGSATIEMATVDGDLRLRSGNASSRVQTVLGSVVVRSGAGDAHFGEVTGALRSGFGSGDLEVAVVRGTVRSRAGSGDARIGAAFADVDLASGSGGVSIGLPPGFAARLDVTTGAGQVQSELPIDDAARAGNTPISVRARTGTGDIRIFRAEPAA
jgi:hypothetical protein